MKGKREPQKLSHEVPYRWGTKRGTLERLMDAQTFYSLSGGRNKFATCMPFVKTHLSRRNVVGRIGRKAACCDWDGGSSI